jgi:hypothetical protein
MSLKLPKSFNKMPHEQKSKWVADELKKIRSTETELLKLSRLLASDKDYTPVMKNDDRPDLIEMQK